MTQSAQRPIRKPRRPRTWTAALLALTVPGCSDMEIDQRDELGLEGEGRSELVVIGEPPQEADDDAPASPYPSDPGPDKPVYFDPNGEFTVQIGLRTDRDKAAAAAAKLAKEGYPAYVIPSADKSGNRVRIGYFKSTADADRFGRIFVASRGGEFWVDLRDNESR